MSQELAKIKDRYNNMDKEIDSLLEEWNKLKFSCGYYDEEEIRDCKHKDNLEPGYADNCDPEYCPLTDTKVTKHTYTAGECVFHSIPKQAFMKLFIFEPHNWAYCGGAIGIISDTFENAIKLIVGEDYERALEETENDRLHPKYLSFKECLEMNRRYKEEYFAKNPKKFKKGLGSDTWILTHTFGMPEGEKERVVFDNWNYA